MINFEEANSLKTGASRYVKLEDGQPVTMRIFDAITGFEIWTEEDGQRKPNRCKPGSDKMHQFSKDVLAKAGVNDWGKPVMPQVFVAFLVYDYGEKNMKIFQVNRVGGKAKILNDLALMQSNPKWGDLKGYDVTVLATKSKPDGRWSASAQPEPADPKDKSAEKAFKETPVVLDALFYGLDPFADNVKEQMVEADVTVKQLKEVEDALVKEEKESQAEVTADDIPF